MTSSPTEHRVSPLVMGVAYLGLAFILALPPVVAVLTLVRLLQARETGRWPTTDAVVTRSELTTEWKGTKKLVQAMVEFDYALDGHQRHGTRVHRTHTASTTAWQSRHQGLVDRFPVGTRTTAVYNPRDPSEAYLLAGAQWSDYTIALAPWLFVIGEVFWAARLASKWRQAQRGENSAAPQVATKSSKE